MNLDFQQALASHSLNEFLYDNTRMTSHRHFRLSYQLPSLLHYLSQKIHWKPFLLERQFLATGDGKQIIKAKTGAANVPLSQSACWQNHP